jgi:alpha-glucosidase
MALRSSARDGATSLKWWQQAVTYEIAPMSFQDSNGDGRGDLPGLIERVDYLAWLGVDAVWLTPIYDKRRIASRIGQPQARIAAMLLLTLKGTPFFFAGDELGLGQVTIPPDRVVDPFEKLVGGYGLNRDPERSPMRWDGSANGGFSADEPWLPMGDDVAERNVEALQADRRSLLWLYQRLIQLRRSEAALATGEYRPLRARNDILSYERYCRDERILIALNIAPEPRKLEWHGEGDLLLSTYLDETGRRKLRGPTLLRPDEGVVVKHPA